jgi:hypothetical protein
VGITHNDKPPFLEVVGRGCMPAPLEYPMEHILGYVLIGEGAYTLARQNRLINVHVSPPGILQFESHRQHPLR